MSTEGKRVGEGGGVGGAEGEISVVDESGGNPDLAQCELLRQTGSDRVFKAILIGDLHAGKTSLFLKISGHDVGTQSTEALGIDFTAISRTVDDTSVKILYFDTAGLESHKYSLSNQYYRQTDAVLFCYSLIDESTIAVLPNWKDDADSQCARSFVKFLVGTKSDLAKEKDDHVSDTMATCFCEKLHCADSYRVSSKTGDGIEEMLVSIARHLKEKNASHRGRVIRQTGSASSEDSGPCRC